MKKIILNADKNNLNILNDFIVEYLEKYSIDSKTIFQLELAVEEIFVNICSYAYTSAYEKVGVSLEVLNNPLSLRITFEDSGRPYNPLERTDPDVTLEAEKREIGGLGVYIVKQIMDECDYKYVNGTNVFSVKKKLIQN